MTSRPAAPLSEPPLVQRREIETWCPGSTDLLDDSVLPALSPGEKGDLIAAEAALRSAKEDEAKAAREIHRTERAAAGHVVAWIDEGDRLVLEGEHEITLSDGQTVTRHAHSASAARAYRLSANSRRLDGAGAHPAVRSCVAAGRSGLIDSSAGQHA